MTATKSSKFGTFLTLLKRILSRYFWLLPLISFGLGWASFILVQRGAELARIIAFLALAGWLWIFAEPFIMNRFLGPERTKLRSTVSNFLTQSIQQEIYFFSLPFLIAATQWRSWGQIAFTGLVVVAALISTVDPWYEKYIALRRRFSLAYHALCCFIAALVILPIAVKLPTEKTLLVALGFLVLWLLIALPKLVTNSPSMKNRSVVCATLCLIPVLIWVLRANIPAAGLHASNGVISTGIRDHDPIDEIDNIAVGLLPNGVYASVAIKAPNGLEQGIVFNWHHDDYSEKIKATITGGRKEGYRTYSVKNNFPAEPMGKWFVDVRTSQGQLLRRMKFIVNRSE